MAESRCSGACRSAGHCDCGAVVDGLVQVGRTIHFGLMFSDQASHDDAPTKGNSMGRLTLEEKRTIVGKAYGEAAVRQMKEAGAKSDTYKAAYAEAAGKLFLANRDDRFIEGFYESLIAGKTVEQAKELIEGRTDTPASTGDSARFHCDQNLIDAEARKPQYDAFRGGITPNGTPLDKHFARMNLENRSPEAQRAQMAYDQMCRNMSEAWKGKPVNDNDGQPDEPVYARDGRPLASLSEVDRAYEKMCIKLGQRRG